MRRSTTPRTRRLRRLRVLGAAAVGAVCLALVPAASAAAPLTYVSPTSIAAKIRGFAPQIPTDNTSPPSTITATTCKGLPPARQQKFNTFRCTAAWNRGRATVWARALPGGTFCASSTGLASCPPGPTIAGDPRICTNAPVPPTADPNRCALIATQFAITRAMPINFHDAGWTIRNVSCTGSNLSRKCTFSSHTAYGIYYSSTIDLKESDGVWTATIVTTGGGGTSTCTVLPGPPGGRSRWTTGPAPTCIK